MLAVPYNKRIFKLKLFGLNYKNILVIIEMLYSFEASSINDIVMTTFRRT